jgi:hypothetical protein
MITFDPSTTSVVITCASCPWWRGFAFTQDKAEATALGHERDVHPETTALRDRLATRDRVRLHRARAAM